MKSKIEYIPEILAMLQKEAGCEDADIKTTIKEDFSSWSFPVIDENQKLALKIVNDELIKKHGWKIDPPTIYKTLDENKIDFPKFTSFESNGTTWYQLLYNPIKDKLTLSTYFYGLRYSHKKHLFYPFKKQTNLLTWNDKMWDFMYDRRGKILYPRLLKTMYLQNHHITRKFFEVITGIKHSEELLLSYKDCLDKKDIWEVLEKKHEVVIPRKLRELKLREVAIILDVVKKDDMAKIMMAISKFKGEYTNIQAPSLISTIIAPNTPYSDYHFHNIVIDWIMDHQKLRRKLSLKITSFKRIETEHRKLSNEIIAMGIKAIKIDPKFKEVKELFKTLPFPSELIENKNRLLQESMDMHHCVATYGPQINRGDCCIVHIDYMNMGFTAQIKQVTSEGKNHYTCNQLLGLRNCRPPEELSNAVSNLLGSHKPGLIEEQVEVLY